MPYTLKFSDASKIETVFVPDMPPGINSIDTSLSLVGRNYPNYGEKIAENFLHLLENFASPLPPENPIEGQLWYDTSDPNNKILRVMDGTADSTRWPSANGIYQQGTDPKDTSTALKVGDIWVDTQNALLKIYHSGDWRTVGPTFSAGLTKTGVEPVELESTLGTKYFVIFNYVNGNVVSIVSDTAFIPKTVIDGFTSLKPGINISANNNAILNGTADTAANLKINNRSYAANRFFIRDDSVQQLITSKVFFQTSNNPFGSEGRDGVVIDNTAPTNNTYVQFYKLVNDAVVLNNTPGGKIIFKTKSSGSLNLVSGMIIENQSVAINTSTNSSYALDINGALRVSGNVILSSTSTNSLTVYGTAQIQKNLLVQQSLVVNNIITASNLLSVGTNAGNGTVVSPVAHNVYDIGSSNRYFRHLYVSMIGSTGTMTTVIGRVIGNATGLEKSSEFKLQGQVTATSFIFAGTGTAATFNSSLTDKAITDQQSLNTTTSTLTLLVIDTSTSATYTGLRKINRADFLKGVVPPGTMFAYAGTTVPSGWLLCDGGSYLNANYSDLYLALDAVYKPPGPNFNVPDMRYSTTSTLGYVSYIIKT